MSASSVSNSRILRTEFGVSGELISIWEPQKGKAGLNSQEVSGQYLLQQCSATTKMLSSEEGGKDTLDLGHKISKTKFSETDYVT